MRSRRPAIIAPLFLPAILVAQSASPLANPLANSEANYHALRTGAPQQTYRVENIELKRDVATITLRNAAITFLPPVLGHVTMAVFSGEGRFQLKAAIPIEEDHLNKLFGRWDVHEVFDSALLCFTDATPEVQGQSKTMALDPRAAGVLADFRRKLREHAETNVEAALLRVLYSGLSNPAQDSSFRAFLHGKADGDLRFMIVPSGVLPDLPSPEEVGSSMWIRAVSARESGIYRICNPSGRASARPDFGGSRLPEAVHRATESHSVGDGGSGVGGWAKLGAAV